MRVIKKTFDDEEALFSDLVPARKLIISRHCEERSNRSPEGKLDGVNLETLMD